MSIRNEWQTPQHIFDACNNRYGPFVRDMAATEENALCEVYCTKKKIRKYSKYQFEDAFHCDWNSMNGSLWCNPPYGPAGTIPQWLWHGYKHKRNTRVFLLPNDSSTEWWHKYVRKANEVVFIKGRVQFIPPLSVKKTSNPWPSVLFVFVDRISAYMSPSPRMLTLDQRYGEFTYLGESLR